jgi:hypothetical protein
LSLSEEDFVLGHGWRMQWERVHRRLDDVRAVYTERPEGTPAAVDATQSFFEAVHWIGNDPSSGVTRPLEKRSSTPARSFSSVPTLPTARSTSG